MFGSVVLLAYIEDIFKSNGVTSKRRKLVKLKVAIQMIGD
jgi:hypothetical protein